MRRLNFVKSRMSNPDKDKIWESGILKLHEKYYKNPELTMVDYELAAYYNQLGNSYNFQDSAKIV